MYYYFFDLSSLLSVQNLSMESIYLSEIKQKLFLLLNHIQSGWFDFVICKVKNSSKSYLQLK